MMECLRNNDKKEVYSVQQQFPKPRVFSPWLNLEIGRTDYNNQEEDAFASPYARLLVKHLRPHLRLSIVSVCSSD